MESEHKPADMSKIRRVSISKRTNLVSVRKFAKALAPGGGFLDFLDSLPMIEHRTNAAVSLRLLIDRICMAREKSRPVSWAIGPHIIKYGLSPLIIQLMKEGLVQCLLFNGAGAIHDTEIAMIGETSEEMGGHISAGDFGMAEETGVFINGAAQTAGELNIGFGEALGQRILDQRLPYSDISLFAQAALMNIPATIHAAIGTDIVHMHPDMDGAATGRASFTDFRIFVTVLRDFSFGGVHINIGSTVILPEVYVKAMTCANNLNGAPAQEFTTVNFDHLSEYRPLMNVVQRGSMDGGEGFEIIGRMEIMIPLLTRLLIARLHDER
jgi:hypothetical protein